MTLLICKLPLPAESLIAVVEVPPAATSQNYLPIEGCLHGTTPPTPPPFPTYRPYNEFKENVAHCCCCCYCYYYYYSYYYYYYYYYFYDHHHHGGCWCCCGGLLVLLVLLVLLALRALLLLLLLVHLWLLIFIAASTAVDERSVRRLLAARADPDRRDQLRLGVIHGREQVRGNLGVKQCIQVFSFHVVFFYLNIFFEYVR